MNRRQPMKKPTAAEPRRGTARDRSTAALFLAWLAMPELGTPVDGPVCAEGAENAPRRRCRVAAGPKNPTRPLVCR